MEREFVERIAARVRKECALLLEEEAIKSPHIWGREALYRAAGLLIEKNRTAFRRRRR